MATSDDPDDPDKGRIEQENVLGQNRVVDERLDPYSGRFFPKEKRTEVLAGVVRNEVAVEGIVRERTWGVLGGRCEGLRGRWEEGLGEWERGGK